MNNSPERRFQNPNFDLNKSPQPVPKGRIGLEAVDASNEITARIESAEARSLIDPLTNCYNRRFFEQYKSSFDPERDEIIGIIYTDINGFKAINDEAGHEVGDSILKIYVKSLKANSRKGDFVIRMGGDEFVILSTNKEKNADFEQELSDRIKNRVLSRTAISFSYGCAVFDPAIDKDLDDTLRRADENMYKQKSDEADLEIN